MVQACVQPRPGRDISWPQRGDTYFPHLLGEPDRMPAGACLERERADGLGPAARHAADADGVIIPAGRKVPAPHPPLIARRVPERQVLAADRIQILTAKPSGPATGPCPTQVSHALARHSEASPGRASNGQSALT